MKFGVPVPIVPDTKAMEQHRVNHQNQRRITQGFSHNFTDRLEADPNASIWFITFTFRSKGGQAIRGLGNSQHLFGYFGTLYTRLLPRLMNHYQRPTKFELQPIALVFLDVDASLREEQGWIIGPGSPLLPYLPSSRSWNVGAQVPHLHCLFLVPGKIRERFEGLMRDPEAFWSRCAGQASNTEECPVPLKTSNTQRVPQSDVFKTLDYASKFVKNAPGRQDTTDYWNIWPTVLSERKPKKNGMPYTKKEPPVAVPRGVTLKTPTLLTSNTA